MFEDETRISLSCPKCGHIFREEIGGLKFQDSVTCARCARKYRYKLDEFLIALQQARDAVANLHRSLGLKKD